MIIIHIWIFINNMRTIFLLLNKIYILYLYKEENFNMNNKNKNYKKSNLII